VTRARRKPLASQDLRVPFQAGNELGFEISWCQLEIAQADFAANFSLHETF
jgi:hypothetical protein